MAWCFEDERTDETDLLLDRVLEEGAWVPNLWVYEVANVLAVGLRRGRLTQEDCHTVIGLLEKLPLTEAPFDMMIDTLVSRAEEYGLTAYDTAYLMTARALGVPLGSLDTQLREACTTIGIDVVP